MFASPPRGAAIQRCSCFFEQVRSFCDHPLSVVRYSPPQSQVIACQASLVPACLTLAGSRPAARWASPRLSLPRFCWPSEAPPVLGLLRALLERPPLHPPSQLHLEPAPSPQDSAARASLGRAAAAEKRHPDSSGRIPARLEVPGAVPSPSSHSNPPWEHHLFRIYWRRAAPRCPRDRNFPRPPSVGESRWYSLCPVFLAYSHQGILALALIWANA
mmetsp:Transcript_490/g.1031  ORF Transcript_490/g.1031 Transcript_490/m.1031 type:complete len:216 (-) Transcript_490:22-669(-)